MAVTDAIPCHLIHVRRLDGCFPVAADVWGRVLDNNPDNIHWLCPQGLGQDNGEKDGSNNAHFNVLSAS
jgi:hypothetical protein